MEEIREQTKQTLQQKIKQAKAERKQVDELTTADQVAKKFPTEKEVESMSINQLADYYNACIDDFKLTNYTKIQKFANKTVGIDRVNHLIWILCMMVERDQAREELMEMLSLKIDVSRLTNREKAGFVWELFVTKDFAMNRTSFIGLCGYANILQRDSSFIWSEKCSGYGIACTDDRSSIVQIIPIDKQNRGGDTKETNGKKRFVKKAKPISEDVPAVKKKFKRASETIGLAPKKFKRKLK